MKFKEALASGLFCVINYGGIMATGAFCALWGYAMGKDDGKAMAYARVTEELDKAIEKLRKKVESEKEES